MVKQALLYLIFLLLPSLAVANELGDAVRQIVREHASILQNEDIKFSSLVYMPTIQNTSVGIPGGLGDFVAQATELAPYNMPVIPLTDRIRTYLGVKLKELPGELVENLFDPVTGEKYSIKFRVFYSKAANNVLSWFLETEDLVQIDADKLVKGRVEAAKTENTKTPYIDLLSSSYKGMAYSNFLMNTVAAHPELLNVHPLIRRYAGRPDIQSLIIQGAYSKAMLSLFEEFQDFSQTIWIQDHHFSPIAGEILLRTDPVLQERVFIIQHLHNAIFQSQTDSREIIDVLGWPSSFYTESYFKKHGQVNMMAGILNIMANHELKGFAVPVSYNHTLELITKERGVGLDDIFVKLYRQKQLLALNNPIQIPVDLEISSLSDLGRKLNIKLKMQSDFNLTQDQEAFLILWNHRFTHQKQIKATLEAIESILELGNNIQFAFFVDVDIGSDPKDVQKLKEMIAKYPDRIAQLPFAKEKEMFYSAGADFSIAPANFEPFGYAPVWPALQLALVATSKTGGQVDIFPEDLVIFMNILPDYKEDANVLTKIKEYLFPWRESISADQRILEHNKKEIIAAILKGEEIFRNPDRKQEMQEKLLEHLKQLAKNVGFKKELSVLLINFPDLFSALKLSAYKTLQASEDIKILPSKTLEMWKNNINAVSPPSGALREDLCRDLFSSLISWGGSN